jgi:protein phosphatase
MAHFLITASSRVGCVIANNEDMIMLDHEFIRDAVESKTVDLTSSDRLILALADGMGGHKCGEVASSEVLHSLRYFFGDLPSNLPADEFATAIRKWLTSISLEINSRGLANPAYSDMGTTVVALAYLAGEFFWMNCGDSRLYLLHKGELRQLTTDHSLSQVLGLKEHSSQIVNCIGGGTIDAYIDLENITDDVKIGDVFLLCSDGLTDMLNDQEIETLLNLNADANALCEAAIKAGGLDNVSACVINVE